jgi:hypothetical protein
MREKQLDGDVAREALVARAPHFTHAAGAQSSLDGVGRDALARLNTPPFTDDLARETSSAGAESRPIAPRLSNNAISSRRLASEPRRARKSARRLAGCSMASVKAVRYVQRSVGMDGTQRPVQPRAPMPSPYDRADRYPKRFGGLLDRETAKNSSTT